MKTSEVGTIFTEQSTQQAAENEVRPNVTMMSDWGKKLASFSGTQSAFELRTASTAAVKER